MIKRVVIFAVIILALFLVMYIGTDTSAKECLRLGGSVSNMDNKCYISEQGELKEFNLSYVLHEKFVK
ncbi:MAG: hypothetical protein WA064_00620 [Candidatus Moraniibacteriota bacterium]